MLRSVKYGLYGAVLAGLVGGTVAWTTADAGKTVHLVVDGQPSTIHTTAADVGDVIKNAGFQLGVHDLLAPSASSHLRDGATIVFKRGRLLRLDVDGVAREVWTTAPTVAQALGELGFTTSDFTTVSRSRRLPLGSTDISVRTPKFVTVVHDGSSTSVTTTDATVGQVLIDLSLTMGAYDRLSVPKDSLVSAGARITLTRVLHRILKRRHPIVFATRSTNDPSLAVGTTHIVSPGRNGVLETTWAAVYVDGQLVGKTKIKSTVLRKPVAQSKRVGTLQPRPKVAVAPPSSGSSSGNRAQPPVQSPPKTPPASSGSPKDIARSMLSSYGWSQDQFGCLDSMWTRESGWRVTAANPSGAYGIPQALPGSKMASAGPDWQNNAATQIRWGLGYIASRYSSPCQAWSIWQAQGWY